MKSRLQPAWVKLRSVLSRGRLRSLATVAFLGGAILVSLLLLWHDRQQLQDIQLQFDPRLLTASVFIEFSGLLLAVPAWHLILRRLKVNLSLGTDLRIYCYTFVGFVLPGGIWPVVGRAALYEREGVSAVRVSIATMIEFLLMGLAGLALYGLTSLFNPLEVVWQRPEVAALIVGLAGLIIHPAVFNRLSRFVQRRAKQPPEEAVQLGYRDLIVLFVLEFLTVLIGGTAVYFLLQSMVLVPVNVYAAVVGAWAIGVAASNLFFWIPGKLIVRDGLMITVLAQVLPLPLALAFVVVVRMWTIGSVLFALVLAWGISRLNRWFWAYKRPFWR